MGHRSRLKLCVLGIVGILLLTGCSSSPSLQEQIKLIEYEKCISAEEASFVVALQKSTREEALSLLGLISDKQKTVVQAFIKDCKKYRP